MLYSLLATCVSAMYKTDYLNNLWIKYASYFEFYYEKKKLKHAPYL